MSITSGLPPRRRLLLGFALLMAVVLIWVMSAELTRVIYIDKPFFATYFETSLFMLYLVGFIFWRPWRRQCLDCFNKPRSLPPSLSGSSDDEDIADIPPTEPLLSDPLYVPVKFDESDKEEAEVEHSGSQAHVHFSNLMEVRHLADSHADEAMLARMSYQATQAAKESIIESYKLTVSDVAKISFMFCMVWFLANFSYHKAINEKNPVIVTTASSTSSLFTLLLAGVFPSSHGDKFTLTKLVSVLASIAGVFLIVFAKEPDLGDDYQIGIIWGVVSSVFYAIYLVMLKRKVDNEDKLDIPMFFGFVGLFNFILIWPGIFVLHYSSYETFQFPSWKVWVYLVLNGLFGTVLAEVLWLWGCFLTSSLIGTISLTLTIPLTFVVESVYNNAEPTYHMLFYIGCTPVVASVLLVVLLHCYDDWDPVWLAFALLVRLLRHLVCWVWKRSWKQPIVNPTKELEARLAQEESYLKTTSLLCILLNCYDKKETATGLQRILSRQRDSSR